MNTAATFDELNHLRYFKLNRNPFPVAPDNRHFFISDQIEQILFEIVHGIVSRKGFMVLTGEIGLGKTTISRKIMNILEEKGIETSLVFYSMFRDVELLREINRDFGLETGELVFGDQMNCLNDFLLSRNRAGKNCTIIIDDAQNLNHKSLELMRLISNLEADQQKLVQILLVGQPELIQKLNRRELRQLESRIIIKKEVRPLNREDLKNYLYFKLNKSGNSDTLRVKNGAIRKIHQISRGNFREVNKLMDRCLYLSYYYNSGYITSRIVKEASLDLNPEKKTPNRIRPFIKAAILGFLVAICLFLYVNDFSSLMLDNLRHYSIPLINDPVIAGPPKEKGVPGNHIGRVTKRIARKPMVPVPIDDFLNAYNLGRYNQELYRSLKHGRLAKIKDEIYHQTGYQMVVLEDIPVFVRRKFGILTYPTPSGKQNLNYLFWKPRLSIDRFYYTYRGGEIKILQKKLAEFSMYRYRVDGIVGKKLMKAVIRFQQIMKLDVTGYPDDKTLFFLFNLKA